MTSQQTITVRLHSSDLGDVTEADFDAWVAYVAERIDEEAGVVVDVESARFGEAGRDVPRWVEDEYPQVSDALARLWEAFCEDESAWPQAEQATA